MAATAVIFDLDNTLTDRERTVVAFAGRFADAHADDLAADVTADAVAAVVRAADGGGYEPRAAVCVALRQRLEWRRTASADTLLAYWRDTFPRCTVARAGAAGLLTTLRAKAFRLGLLSNGGGPTQRRKLRAIGVHDAFDRVLISGEVGMRKPDRRVFGLALDRLGVAATDAWFVGDHPLYDVDGARAAGLRAVWLAGAHPWPARSATPEFVIHALDELHALVDPPRPVGS